MENDFDIPTYILDGIICLISLLNCSTVNAYIR